MQTFAGYWLVPAVAVTRPDVANVPAVLWPTIAALVSAPAVLSQLASGYADMRMAFFVACGLLAGAATFAVLSVAGLVWIYVISRIPLGFCLGATQDRITSSVVLGCAALAPLVIAEIGSQTRADVAASVSRT